MATNPTPTIAGTMRNARRGVIEHFTGAGATSSGSALTYQPQHHAERRALSYLMGREVVRMTQEGRYWVDEASAADWRRENATRTALLVGGLLAAAAAGAYALSRSRRGRSD